MASAAFDADVDAARQHVQFPAIGLIVIGALSLALGILVAVMTSTWAFSRDGSDGLQILLALPAIFVFTVLPTAMIVGGVKMLRLADYRWAVGASVLAVSPIPAGPLWLLSLPLGIWSLVVLARPEVKRGFELLKQRCARDRQQPEPRGAREPERRYQHASEVKADMESISKEDLFSAHTQTKTRDVILRTCGILLVLLGLLGSVMGFIGLVIGVIAWLTDQKHTPSLSNVLGFAGMFVLGDLVAVGGWRLVYLSTATTYTSRTRMPAFIRPGADDEA